MCGIVGYKGKEQSSTIIIEGLKKLEYRGYDSWGVALKNSKLHIAKEIGQIGSFTNTDKIPESHMGIGHTRWATHGGVTKENAHPHTSCDGKIAVVHNGIIENYQELKKELSPKHKFLSETDTEVIPHLIEEYIELGFEEAFKKAISRLEGQYAIVAIHEDHDKILAAKNGSPLILGIGEGEYFIASDLPAFLEHTRQVIYLEDHEMIIANSDMKILNLKTGEEIKKEPIKINLKIQHAEKNGYPHFMLKEIHQQKETLKKVLEQNEEEIQEFAKLINIGFGTFFIACGTSYHAALVASYIFSSITKKHINVVLASEFPNYEHFLKENTLVIPISQSGETADVISAIKTARKKGSKISAIINVEGSELTRLADTVFLTNTGPEIAVASTKAFTSQVALLTMLAYACIGKLDEAKKILNYTADKVDDMLQNGVVEKTKEVAKKIKDKNSIFIIGRGANYPISLEAALKIKEISYIHAEGLAGGELKHGTLALIEKGTPCIVMMGQDENKKETISNATEIKARGGYMIGIGPEDNDVFDYHIKVPNGEAFSPIINIIPAQLIAYYTTLERGLNPDKPRNLAKSVTVK